MLVLSDIWVRIDMHTKAVAFYFGMFFSVALSGLKFLEIYDPGVPLTLHPRLYTVALSGLSSQAFICFFESTILSSVFRMRRPCIIPPKASESSLMDWIFVKPARFWGKNRARAESVLHHQIHAHPVHLAQS